MSTPLLCSETHAGNCDSSLQVADRGLAFVQAFSRTLGKQERQMPFCFRESWVFTACLTLVKATAERHLARTHAAAAAAERDFYRLQVSH